MKKVLVLVLTFVTCSFVNAQEDEIRFGVKGGPHLSGYYGLGVDIDLKSKLGFHIGALVEIPLSDKFAVQPELLFSTQGAKDDGLNGLTGTIKDNYLNIPIIGKFYTAKGFSIQAGPQIGFLVSSKVKVEYQGESNTQDVDDVKPIDFGINFGVGYQLKQGVFFDLRSYAGLYNTDDSEYRDIDYPVKQSLLQLSVGYKF